MTLEDAFNGVLTSKVKGLQKLSAALLTSAAEVKELVEAGNLAALRLKLADMRGKVGQVEKVLAQAQDRATQLTVDEKGGILDLSVPANQRK